MISLFNKGGRRDVKVNWEEMLDTEIENSKETQLNVNLEKCFKKL